jgi:molybdopterin-guanine dinucleotide biosynthesis protein A
MERASDATVGLVLAGGRSSRMGRDKAMLPWRDDTLLAYMQRRLCESGVTRVIVSGAYPGHDTVPDRFADLGPLGGLASVAAALPDVPLLVVPVDMPLLDPALLRYLRVSSSSEVCACFQHHPLPLYLRLNHDSRRVLDHLLNAAAQQRSLRALHTALSGKSFDVPAGYDQQLQDADTPVAWQRLTMAGMVR